MTSYDKFAATMFGNATQNKLNILQNEMNSFTQRLDGLRNTFKENMIGVYNKVKDNLVTAHEQMFSSSKLREVQNYLMSTSSSLQDGFIHLLNKKNYLLNMDTKEFVLSHPQVYRLHDTHLLNEFNNMATIDRNISIPEFREDYIKTYNHVAIQQGDRCCIQHFQQANAIEELPITEVAVRIAVWNVVSEMLNDGEDPTLETRLGEY